MYYHMEAFKKVDIIVTPTTGYGYHHVDLHCIELFTYYFLFSQGLSMIPSRTPTPCE